MNDLDEVLRIMRLTTPDEVEAVRASFVDAYRRIFAGPPYEEDFTEQEASDVLDRLMAAPHHINLVALEGDQVVAFGSAIPLTSDPVVARELVGLVPVRHTMYLAELGIDEAWRGRGLGRLLVKRRIQLIDEQRYSHVVLRVPVGRQASVLDVYRSLDFTAMGVSMKVTRRRIDGTMRTDERQFWSRVLRQLVEAHEE